KQPEERYTNIPSLVAAWQQAVSSRDDSTTWLQESLGILPSSEGRAASQSGPPAADHITLTDVAIVENPYKGLRAFGSADAADFFGRDVLVEKLLESLADHSEQARFLAVVGPSGSGKSSVVRAGLLPALRRGELAGSERWFVIEMLPGAYPLEEL